MARRRGANIIGYTGIALALPFFVWFAAGLIPGVPTMVEIFGVEGLRTPASIAVAGLLLAAIGFWDY